MERFLSEFESLSNQLAETHLPELLKHEFKGCWSRRITDEHRIIYKVSAESIFILSCKGHYDD